MNLLLTCLVMFSARIIDVTLGTIRTIISIKGKTILSSIIAFIEVTIWFLVAKKALTTVDNILIVLSYSLGYATGNFIGTYISKNYIKGLIKVEVITKKINKKFIKTIRDNGYALSVIELKKELNNNKKYLLIIEVVNKKQNNLIKLLKELDENIFIIINESKVVYNGFIK